LQLLKQIKKKHAASITSTDSPAPARASAYSQSIRKGHTMTDHEYITAYQKIAGKYENNQSTMEDYLEAMKKLKEKFLKEKPGTAFPSVP